uniref:Immunoglobulin domain-containing protein n=1 Tax=Erpetoichthys calabaricus TaxID=27687 RepID=A0A8C4SL35_ERPCA
AATAALQDRISGTTELQPDRAEQLVAVGGDIMVSCRYDRRMFVFNKKYWCQGESRHNCVILISTEGQTQVKQGRFSALDNRQGLFLVRMEQIILSDAGVYWCAIDKMYADIMSAVRVTVQGTLHFVILLRGYTRLGDMALSDLSEGANRRPTNSGLLLLSLCNSRHL